MLVRQDKEDSIGGNNSNDKDFNSDNTCSFLGVSHEDQSTPWGVTLQVNGKAVDFHIDTGTEVTVVASVAR